MKKTKYNLLWELIYYNVIGPDTAKYYFYVNKDLI